MNHTPKPLIIIAEDDKDLATLIATQLEVAGMQSQICHEASHVERYLKSNFANLILLDVHLPDDTGFNLMHELRQSGNETPVIFLTGENAEIKKVKALEMGGPCRYRARRTGGGFGAGDQPRDHDPAGRRAELCPL